MVVGMERFGATESNPSGSRPNFFGRQHLTFDKGGKFSAEQGYVVLLQWLWGWRGSVQREGQAHSPTKSEWDSANVKQAERSFKGKGVGGFRGMVRM